ncbi:cytokine receptor-like factor 3 [Macrosteles quadrilineatus]|uniref:cytokine receptor-like factor 3 n=1 Tax=Macrosteles quadrilineatus TaxID=74068 RepID=UPI0023E09DF1|nr:cytokine receptor-like factor 3 [Macrosteles quadrilineatus]
MENITKKTLLETVDTAIEYSAKLDRNLNSVIGAEQQVIGTAEESLTEIDVAFDDLAKSVLDALNKRREVLKKNVMRIQEEGLAPLRACRDVISHTLKTTQSYICEGQELMEQRNCDVERSLKYIDQSSLLGSLPAVPNLEEVPAISFQLNVDSLRNSLVCRILSAGVVSRMGPVQITSIVEKPGALLVNWEEVEERGLDDQCFRLQLSVGAHPTPLPRHSAAVYRDVYQGADSSCVVRDVHPGTQYTLRVCCKDERGDWCAWSLPRVAATTLPAFCECLVHT